MTVGGDLFVCRLACLCGNGSSDIPPDDLAPDGCPHSMPHVPYYSCNREADGCNWSNLMGFSNGCRCIPEDQADKLRMKEL
jgi:hypothetical protein